MWYYISTMKYRNRRWLYSEYITKCKTMREVAKSCGTDHVTILHWLKRFNIPTRKSWTKYPIYFNPSNGYLYISRGRKPPILYHRHLMEKHLNRPLRTSEIVHHKDGNKLNNELNNLKIINHQIHNSIHKSYENLSHHKYIRRWPHYKGCQCGVCKKQKS